MLSVTIEDLGDVVVLRCVGRIVAGREVDILRDCSALPLRHLQRSEHQLADPQHSATSIQ